MPCALAQTDTPPETGLYVGAGAGIARDDGNYTFTGASVTSQDLTNPGAKIYVGYRLIRYFGVEIGYAKLGATSFEGTDERRALQRTIHARGSAAVARGFPAARRPVGTHRAPGFGHQQHLQHRAVLRASHQLGHRRAAELPSTPIAWGLGVRYRVGQKWGVRVDYDSYALKDSASSPRAELNFFSVGADYRF